MCASCDGRAARRGPLHRFARVGPSGRHRFRLQTEVGRTDLVGRRDVARQQDGSGLPDRSDDMRGPSQVAPAAEWIGPGEVGRTARRATAGHFDQVAIRVAVFPPIDPFPQQITGGRAEEGRPRRAAVGRANRRGEDGVFDEHVGPVERAGRGARIKVKVLRPGRQRARVAGRDPRGRGWRANADRKCDFPRRAASSRTPGDATTSRR